MKNQFSKYKMRLLLMSMDATEAASTVYREY